MKYRFKLIIAGSRNFKDYYSLSYEVHNFLESYGISDQTRNDNYKQITILSGTARGADSLGEKYAINHGFIIEKYPANWDKYGKKAGYLRNEEMAKNATHCIVFWDGQSHGTKHMINLANHYKLDLKIVRY